MLEDVVLNVVGGSLLLAVARIHWNLVRTLEHVPPRFDGREPWPSITVVHPIRGLDAGFADNLEAVFETDYEGDVEHLFVFDDADEPALPLVEEAIRRRQAGGRARVVLAGHPPPGRTGKLNAMLAAQREARGELFAVCDSDTRPGPEALRALVDALRSRPDSGSAFAPVVVPSPAETPGDVGYALMLNGLYGPEAARAAERTGSLPFIMGQLMIFRPAALEAIGGLEALSGQLVDDMHLGRLLSAKGYRNVVARYRLPIIEYGMSLPEFVLTYRRWIIFSRSGLPDWQFKWPAWLRGLEFWVALLLGAGAIATDHPLGALLPAVALLASAYSIADLHRHIGGAPIAPRHAWVPLALLLIAPIVYLSIYLRPTVTWRGRAYGLDAGGRLAPRSQETPAPSVRGGTPQG